MGAENVNRIAPAPTSVDAPAADPPIENRTFDEIEVGDSASLERTSSWRDGELFAVLSSDIDPAHVDEEHAGSDRFHGIVAHRVSGASLISTLLGTRLPGPGPIYLEQTLRFRHPITIGDTISVSVTVESKGQTRHRVVFDCRCVNQRGEIVIDGTAKVLAPTEKFGGRAWCSPRCRRASAARVRSRGRLPPAIA